MLSPFCPALHKFNRLKQANQQIICQVVQIIATSASISYAQSPLHSFSYILDSLQRPFSSWTRRISRLPVRSYKQYKTQVQASQICKSQSMLTSKYCLAPVAAGGWQHTAVGGSQWDIAALAAEEPLRAGNIWKVCLSKVLLASWRWQNRVKSKLEGCSEQGSL